MAIIGKIREKSWLICVIVGGALLAFIFTDYNKGASGLESKYGYGTVYGEKVSIEEYNEALSIADENAARNAQQQQQPKQPVDEVAVWNGFVEKLLLEKEYEALGIDVSASEFDAYLYGKDGFQVLPDLAQGFTDSITGMFNEKLLQSRIEEMESSDDPEVQKQWDDSKNYYTDKRKQEKYVDILNQGMYVTNLEAKNEYFSQKEVKSISYVLKRYTDVLDEDIDASEEKLKAYYEKHKEEKKYENTVATRDIRYFDVTIQPSQKDSAQFQDLIKELKGNFEATTDDSAFVMLHSENKYFIRQIGYRPDGDPNAKEGFTYPKRLDSIFKTTPINGVVGPYEEGGATKIAKVIDLKTKLLGVRHILISAQRGDTAAVEKAQKKTDSLMAFVNADNFEAFVQKFSEDPGSKTTGGKYENFVDGEMVPEFSNYAMEQPVGKIGYVQTDFGFHIIEVLSRKEGYVPNLAIIQKTLKPSQEARDIKESEIDNLIYKLDEELSQIESEQGRVEMFDTVVAKAGYVVRPLSIQDNSPKLYGFSSKFAEDKILKLAYGDEAMVGNLVDSPIKDKDRYVIAVLAAIKEKGTPTFEDVKITIERDCIQDQKAKILVKKMKGAGSLKILAKKLDGAEVVKAEITFANPQFTGVGLEPKIVGALFSALKDGEQTVPLEGKAGVFVVRVENTTKAPTAANYLVERDQMLTTLKGSLLSSAKKGLVKLGDVVDNRRFFNANIRR